MRIFRYLSVDIYTLTVFLQNTLRKPHNSNLGLGNLRADRRPLIQLQFNPGISRRALENEAWPSAVSS